MLTVSKAIPHASIHYVAFLLLLFVAVHLCRKLGLTKLIQSYQRPNWTRNIHIITTMSTMAIALIDAMAMVDIVVSANVCATAEFSRTCPAN